MLSIKKGGIIIYRLFDVSSEINLFSGFGIERAGYFSVPPCLVDATLLIKINPDNAFFALFSL